jgi:MoxR-like ATPase
MQSESVVSSWLRGRAKVKGDQIQFANAITNSLTRKAHLAYRWIVENAIYAPYFDIEYGTPVRVGKGDQQIWITEQDSYVSFALLPILNLFTCQRLLLLGSPGRGKTTMASLMGLIAGVSLVDLRHAVQHGHPQMTHADLLGSPLPSDLVRAETPDQIRVIWKRWLKMRVKIIDEYNRIPTKTQSALLSLMAEGYAELYEQTVETGRSAWFLTANDESGGGTFPVITALKDRIDAVVRTTPFNTEYLEALAKRVESARSPEQLIPREIVFSPDELAQAQTEIRAIPVPPEVVQALGFLLGQLDFCRRASARLEYMNKDTLMLAGKRLAHVCTEDCPLDKSENICSQTENGVSARVYQSILLYAKAIAWFRGGDAVEHEDIRQILPWVLHEKLRPNPASSFFQKLENQTFLIDQLSWLRQLYDRAGTIKAAYQTAHQKVADAQKEVLASLGHMNHAALQRASLNLRRQMEDLLNTHELNAPVHHDLLALKQLITLCQNRMLSLEDQP